VFGPHPAATLLNQQFDELFRSVHALREGSTDAVHDARVSIRRLREELLLMAAYSDTDEFETIQRRLKRAGRALSRLRDADVAQALSQSTAAGFSRAPDLIRQLRSRLLLERDTSWRKAVKRLEALKLHDLYEQMPHLRSSRLTRGRLRRGWRRSMRRHLISRADELRRAIEHAGSVYFPNRLHQTRIATKRLRYALELADRTGGWRPRGAVATLKRAQDVLGDAHDREMFLTRLDELRTAAPDRATDNLDSIEQLIQADIRARHREYLALRPGVEAICDALSTRTPKRRTALLVGGVGVTSLVLLRRAMVRGWTPGMAGNSQTTAVKTA
jgi:CHAD domain-containing protein